MNFKRAYALKIGGADFSAQDVSFSVKKTTEKDPNTAEIKVYNLSRETRAKLQDVATPVMLSAGYEGNVGVIFSGETKTISHEQEGADVVTTLVCGDGSRAYRFARANFTLGPGTSNVDVLKRLADTFVAEGAGRGNLDQFLASTAFKRITYPRGFTASGLTREIFDQVLRSSRTSKSEKDALTWSFQNQAIQVITSSGTFNALGPLLSADTGLIGSPKVSAPEKLKGRHVVEATSLLVHQVVCGGAVSVRSRDVTGEFKIRRLEHKGNNAGADWYTEMELQAL